MVGKGSYSRANSKTPTREEYDWRKSYQGHGTVTARDCVLRLSLKSYDLDKILAQHVSEASSIVGSSQ